MKEVAESDITTSNYFIPHHYVLKPGSSTTKLRVVFDTSAKSSSGAFLNDFMYNGPTVQSDLFAILLRFRLPRYVFSTDVEKMYRQIMMSPGERILRKLVNIINCKR